MQLKTGYTRPGSPLMKVLPEIVEKLETDDWMRCATTDDSSFYYIIGMKAHAEDQTGGVDHMSLSIPRGAPVSVLGEHQVHSQVASPRSSGYYIGHAISKLVSCGVDRDLLNRFAKGDSLDLSFLHGHIDQPGTESFQAFSDLLQAMLLAKGMEPVATEAERRSELAAAVQKLYLRELSKLYGKVVERAASMEVLTFSDPQLNEASRCYLYGFFRAAVVLCGSALESNLRNVIGPSGVNRVDQRTRTEEGRRRGFFDCLVDEADSHGMLGTRVRQGKEPESVTYSRRVFDRRTEVVHKGSAPTSDVAEELLTQSREVVEFIRSPSHGNGHEA